MRSSDTIAAAEAAHRTALLLLFADEAVPAKAAYGRAADLYHQAGDARSARYMRECAEACGAPAPTPAHLPWYSHLGTTFEGSELILIRSWAEFHTLRVRTELEDCWGIETLAEVIALYPTGSPSPRWMVRRHTDAVEIQHLSGERQIVRSVPDALDSMIAPLPEPSSEDIQLCNGPLGSAMVEIFGRRRPPRT